MSREKNLPFVFYATHSGLAHAQWLWMALNAHPHMLVLQSYDAIHNASIPACCNAHRGVGIAARTRMLQMTGQEHRAVGEILMAHPLEFTPAMEASGRELTLVHLVQHPIVFVENDVRWRRSLSTPERPWCPTLENEWCRARTDIFMRARLMPFKKEDIGIWAAYQAISKLGQTLDVFRRGVPCYNMESLSSHLPALADLVASVSGDTCAVDGMYFEHTRRLAEHWSEHSPFSLDPSELWQHWPYWQKEAFFRLLSSDILDVYIGLGYDFSFCN